MIDAVSTPARRSSFEPNDLLDQAGLIDEQADLEAAVPVLAALPIKQRAEAQPWVEYLQIFLHAIGGILGAGPTMAQPADHPCAGRPAYTVPQRAQRDPRFLPAVVESPRRPPQNVREQQVWYAIDHANEIWAAEVPGALMWERPNMPWEFYLDVARWGYDEQRHSEMGIRRLSAWGFETGVERPPQPLTSPRSLRSFATWPVARTL